MIALLNVKIIYGLSTAALTSEAIHRIFSLSDFPSRYVANKTLNGLRASKRNVLIAASNLASLLLENTLLMSIVHMARVVTNPLPMEYSKLENTSLIFR